MRLLTVCRLRCAGADREDLGAAVDPGGERRRALERFGDEHPVRPVIVEEADAEAGARARIEEGVLLRDRGQVGEVAVLVLRPGGRGQRVDIVVDGGVSGGVEVRRAASPGTDTIPSDPRRPSPSGRSASRRKPSGGRGRWNRPDRRGAAAAPAAASATPAGGQNRDKGHCRAKPKALHPQSPKLHRFFNYLADLGLRVSFYFAPSEGAPPPGFAWSPSPANAGEDYNEKRRPGLGRSASLRFTSAKLSRCRRPGAPSGCVRRSGRCCGRPSDNRRRCRP